MSEHDTPQTPNKVFPHSYKDAANSEYVTAEDLKGKDWTLTISEVELRTLEDDKGKHNNRLIIWFKGKEKAWVSIFTNNLCLEAMFGEDPQNLVGKRVTLNTEMVNVGNERKLGIRVKGSPDLDKDKTIMIKLPRRRAFKKVLVKTGTTATTQTDDKAEPGAVMELWIKHCADDGLSKLDAEAEAAKGFGVEGGVPTAAQAQKMVQHMDGDNG